MFSAVPPCEERSRPGRHTLPSSFAGESVDLVKEDDGGSDDPRLPKHLQASATIEKREADQTLNRDT